METHTHTYTESCTVAVIKTLPKSNYEEDVNTTREEGSRVFSIDLPPCPTYATLFVHFYQVYTVRRKRRMVKREKVKDIYEPPLHSVAHSFDDHNLTTSSRLRTCFKAILLWSTNTNTHTHLPSPIASFTFPPTHKHKTSTKIDLIYSIE